MYLDQKEIRSGHVAALDAIVCKNVACSEKHQAACWCVSDTAGNPPADMYTRDLLWQAYKC